MVNPDSQMTEASQEVEMTAAAVQTDIEDEEEGHREEGNSFGK